MLNEKVQELANLFLARHEVSDHFADVGKMIQGRIHDPYL